jgi:hypothetical protein
MVKTAKPMELVTSSRRFNFFISSISSPSLSFLSNQALYTYIRGENGKCFKLPKIFLPDHAAVV